MTKYFHYLLLLFSIGFLSCANIKPPTGGPEDTAPPKLLKSTPANNSVNFKGRTIVLEFDEFVDAQKLREDLIISPIKHAQYDVTTKKKSVIIRFTEDLHDSTTYSFSFGESIKDITKGNYVKDLHLAFSTGPTIDSLSIKGTVKDFISDKGLNDISIEMYDFFDTITIKNGKPTYFTRSNKNGSYTIRNIKEGTYTIYALQDLNDDYIYNPNKENIDYKYKVLINNKLTTINFGLTKPDSKPPEIIQDKQEFDYILLALNEGIEKYAIRKDSVTNFKILSEQLDPKTIKIFNNFNSKDTVILYVQLTDSSQNTAEDTVKILFPKYSDPKNKNRFKVKLDLPKPEILNHENILFRATKPIQDIDYKLINIKTDSIKITSSPKNIQLDSSLFKITISNLPPFKDSLVVQFQTGALTSYSGDTSEKYKIILRPKKEENYGILAGIIKCDAPNYLFQLIDDKSKIQDTKKNPTSFHYDYVEPGTYELKIIIDVNNNNRWDPIDLENNIPPEPIKYYKEKINLRANWEIIDLIFDAKQ
ncbi:MAG TPA: Ig-like domain-containing domain [Cytophagaceae bacterium]|jgi:uncharacterized protein (DUF2141 family)|nr:Ig-like domain-containing domain [Cytophagaceae bacterium]